MSAEQSVAAAGMLCTLSWARERGFENADIPLHVYGPPGLADYIRYNSLQQVKRLLTFHC